MSSSLLRAPAPVRPPGARARPGAAAGRVRSTACRAAASGRLRAASAAARRLRVHLAAGGRLALGARRRACSAALGLRAGGARGLLRHGPAEASEDRVVEVRAERSPRRGRCGPGRRGTGSRATSSRSSPSRLSMLWSSVSPTRGTSSSLDALSRSERPPCAVRRASRWRSSRRIAGAICRAGRRARASRRGGTARCARARSAATAPCG